MVNIKNSPLPPEVKVMLDKERTLKYPIPAIWAFEDISGVEVLKGIASEEDFYGPNSRSRMTRVIQLLWAGLITDEPGITYDFVKQYVYLKNLKQIDEKVAEAFKAALPEPEEEKAKEVSGSDPLATSGPVN